MEGFKEVDARMSSDDFYKALDSVVPGGALEALDRSVVPDRKLYLTRVSMDGLEGMHEYSKDARLYRYFEFEPFKDIKETRTYLQKMIDRIGDDINNRKCMYWFLRTVENHKIIGSIGLVDIDLHRDSAAWGYAISPEYWGRGHILETQLLVVVYFFEVLKLNRLWGVTLIDNEPTISSVLAAGFQKEGILRDYYKRANGERVDGFIYSLLAKDYYGAKEGRTVGEKSVILTIDQLKKIYSSAFGISGSRVNEDTNIVNLAEWDSLNHVVLITLIEKEVPFKFKPAEIARATSVRSILEIVNGSGKTTRHVKG